MNSSPENIEKIDEEAKNTPENVPHQWARFFRGAVLGTLINTGLPGCMLESEKLNHGDRVNDEYIEILDIPEQKITEVKIDGKTVKIQEMPRRKSILTERHRVMPYPMSDEAKENIKKLSKNEKLTIFHDGVSDEGHPFQIRETASKAYKLAEAYTEGLGYCLEPISSSRTKKHQDKLYANAPASHKGTLVANGDLSNHRTGSSVDVTLCKIVDGKKQILTPVRGQNPKHFKKRDLQRLEMLMNLAGFVRYKKEEWHFEVGSQDAYHIMVKAGVLPKGQEERYTYPILKD